MYIIIRIGLTMSSATDTANKIFLSLGEPFLSQREAGKLPSMATDLQTIYEALMEILQERKSPQSIMDRLKAKALLDDIHLSEEKSKKIYGSNILLGFGVDL